jgi:FMN-dependent NADH-azoreductase
MRVLSNARLASPTSKLMFLICGKRMPEFNGDKATAKMTFPGVGEMIDETQSAWDQIVAITQRFTDAD